MNDVKIKTKTFVRAKVSGVAESHSLRIVPGLAGRLQ